MVEGSMNEISEQEFLDAMFLGHEEIKKQVAWQLEVQKEVGLAKEESTGDIDWPAWEKLVDDFLTEDRVKNIYKEDKVERNQYLEAMQDTFKEENAERIEQAELPSRVIDYIFDTYLNTKVTNLIIAMQRRVDGRPYDQVRPISIDVGLLPFTHGSALFTRGRTQALVTLTLGGGQDEQKIEDLMPHNMIG